MRQILKLKKFYNKHCPPQKNYCLKNAQTNQKKTRLLYIHFFVFVLGCIFFFVANKILDYGVEYNWYLWLSLIWLFLWLWHAMNVFVFNRFLGKKWQEKQREQLIAAQQKKLIKMEAAVEREFELQKEQAKKELDAADTSNTRTV